MIFLVRIHQSYIIKFGVSVKHCARKRAQCYNISMLAACHVCNTANQGQSNVAMSKVGVNTGIVDYQLVRANANKCYFTDFLTMADGIETIAGL